MELTPIEKERYKEYEELILNRDELQALAESYLNQYIETFGELITTSYAYKVDCIKLKKMISLCQSYLNRGLPIDSAAINYTIEAQMEIYYQQLKSLEREYENTKNSIPISENEVIRIKKLYRKLAKLIHPDLNPELAFDQTIKDLWNRIVVAYNCNNYKELIELEVLVHKALSENGYKDTAVDIPDIEEKIAELEAEIVMIREQDVLPYKTILEDEEAIEVKKRELEEEVEEYKLYQQQLQEELSQYDLREVPLA